MENKVSEILENILGLLGLEGSFEVNEAEEEINVVIETEDAGRLIGYRGETLDALQLIVNLIDNRQNGSSKDEQSNYKRVIIDVAGWRKNREEDLKKRALEWAETVKDSGKSVELEPMPAWQRRIVHMALSEVSGVESESLGEGKDRHLVIKTAVDKTGNPDSSQA